MLKPHRSLRSHATTPGALLGVLAFALVVLVAATPVTDLKLTGDANANGWSLTNADNITATNGYFDSLTATNGITGTLQWSNIVSTPTNLAGYGIVDALTNGSPLNGTNIIAGTASPAILSGGGATAGNALVWNGTQYAPGVVSGTGGYFAGAGLTLSGATFSVVYGTATNTALEGNALSSSALAAAANAINATNGLASFNYLTSNFTPASALGALASSNTVTWSLVTATPTNFSGYGLTTPLLPANNLSDLGSASTARSNLGLGTLATSNSITASNITGLGSGVATALGMATDTNNGVLLVGSGLYDANGAATTAVSNLLSTNNAFTGTNTFAAVTTSNISAPGGSNLVLQGGSSGASITVGSGTNAVVTLTAGATSTNVISIGTTNGGVAILGNAGHYAGGFGGWSIDSQGNANFCNGFTFGTASYVGLSSAKIYAWYNANYASGTVDTGLSRDSAAVVDVGNGGYQNASGTLRLATLAPGSGIVGTTNAGSAPAGDVGEFVSSAISSTNAVTLTNAASANATSISLTAGDWDVSANANFSTSNATVTQMAAAISSSNATLSTDGSECYAGLQLATASAANTIACPCKRISISSTTTVYLVVQANFSAGSITAFGAITARRVR